jgi:protein-tyrosine-phosphatase
VDSPRAIVFVCLHGAAKSVVAASYCRRLAEARGLDIDVAAAGVEPEPEVPPGVVSGLLDDGIDLGNYRPREITRRELETAWRIVSFGCDLQHLAPPGKPVLRWDNVPPVSEDFAAARDAIVARVSGLLDDGSPGG